MIYLNLTKLAYSIFLVVTKFIISIKIYYMVLIVKYEVIGEIQNEQSVSTE